MVITFYLIDVLLISFLILLWFSAYSIILFLAPFTLESSSIFLAIFSNFFFLIVMKDLNSSLCFITSRIRLFSFCFKFGNLRLVASPWGVESCEGFLKKSLFYSYKRKLFFSYASSCILIFSFGVTTNLSSSSRLMLCSTIVLEFPKLNCSFCLILFVFFSFFFWLNWGIFFWNIV